MTKTRSLSLTLLVLFAAPAAAQAAPPLDDPHFVEQPAPVEVPTRVEVRTVCKRRCQDAATRINLHATLGYAGFLGPLFLDKMHGPQLGGALVVDWGRGTRLGVRLAGYAARLTGTSEPFLWGETDHDARRSLYGGSVGLQANFVNGLWLAKTLGVQYYDFDPDDGDSDDGPWLFELVLAGGYDLHLGKHLALQLGVELGTTFISFRVAANVGVKLSF
jgi:hypothetical protein